MNSTGIVAVDNYLGDVRRLARVLPRDAGAELVTDIERHVRDAMERGELVDESSAWVVLDRLGVPGEVVRAAADLEGVRVTAKPEGWTVAWLTVGSLIPLLGWLIGVSRVWSSRLWSLPQKVAMTVLIPLGLSGALWFTLMFAPLTSYGCSSGTANEYDSAGQVISSTTTPLTCSSSTVPGWVGFLLVVVVFLVAIAVPVSGLVSARRLVAQVRRPVLLPLVVR